MSYPSSILKITLKKLIDKTLSAVAPPTSLTCSQWADRFRFLSPESSAAPGRWSTGRAEFQREILDSTSDPMVEETVVQSSAQVGKTEIINNTIGYYIDQDPSPLMLLQPTLQMAEAYSKDRLAPMIRDTPVLFKKIGSGKSKDGNSTILHKKGPGWQVTLAGSNSPASLASRPIRITLFDEIDRYGESAGDEGDPVKLAKKRSTTFYNRKSVSVSTPTLKGKSRIAKAYEGSDQRQYHVPCPHCENFQTLKWENLKFINDDSETTTLYCEHCGEEIKESKKTQMLKNGKWIARKPFKGIAGFHLNELYSPWKKWKEIVADYLEAVKIGPAAMQVFINTSLGLEYEPKEGEVTDWRVLFLRKENYQTKLVPKKGLLLTCGIDVQKERFELEVIAWGRNKETWSIDYQIITGDTSSEKTWDALDEYLNTPIKHESGAEMFIDKIGIDSGFNTQEVYRWVRRQSPRRVFALKGNDNQSVPLAQPKPVDIKFKKSARKIKKGLLLYSVGVNLLKTEFYGWLKIPQPLDSESVPHGYCHFPEVYDEEYFKMLTAEEMVAKTVKGYRKYIWEKTRERNEALDCRVYNRAVSIIHGIDRYKEKDWLQIESDLGGESPVTLKDAESSSKPKRKKVKNKVQQNDNDDSDFDLNVSLDFGE
jgi:phage terminase large subunit GpA-like protein